MLRFIVNVDEEFAPAHDWSLRVSNQDNVGKDRRSRTCDNSSPQSCWQYCDCHWVVCPLAPILDFESAECGETRISGLVYVTDPLSVVPCPLKHECSHRSVSKDDVDLVVDQVAPDAIPEVVVNGKCHQEIYLRVKFDGRLIILNRGHITMFNEHFH